MTTVQRMLDYYRPGAVEPQRVDLVILLRHVINLLLPQLQARGIRVNTGFSSKLTPDTCGKQSIGASFSQSYS